MRFSIADVHEHEQRRHSQSEAEERQRSVSFGAGARVSERAGGEEAKGAEGYAGRVGGESYAARAGGEVYASRAGADEPQAYYAPPPAAGYEYAYPRYGYDAGPSGYEYAPAPAPCFIPAAPQHRTAPQAQYTLPPPQPRRTARQAPPAAASSSSSSRARAPPGAKGPSAAERDPDFVVRPRARARLHVPAGETATGAGASGGVGAGNQINVERIEAGADTRTTVMIKNIPNKMSDRDLLEYIAAVCPRRIDFFYLRMDFQNGCNVGYAFVNFITVDDLVKFAKAKLGTKWNMYSSEKVLQMSYANYQGKEALVEKFKNSGIMDERPAWRPKIFFSDGPEQGRAEQFPPPTHQQRKVRSAHNRGALFVPGGGVRG
ncbi:hypothetical protein DENSPDRAFT_827788 [Dentipellis sp. KUC8613]|nr:hypothetical protein DENSPDRAFT_827788 [Dentipellis sp. KUC8613]